MDMSKCLTGCILGKAVGDALGFVIEGYGKDVGIDYVQKIILPRAIPHMLRLPQFAFGQYSDDTQLARELLVSISQTEGRIDPNVYATRIAMMFQKPHYRIVGYGKQTERAAHAILRGEPHHRSGCLKGNGNGSAMRSAPIGVLLARFDAEKVATIARTLSAITHASPRSMDGSVIVALAAQYAVNTAREAWSTDALIRLIQPHIYDDGTRQFLALFTNVVNSPWAEARAKVKQMGRKLKERRWAGGMSVSVLQSVLWSLYAVCNHPNDYVKAISCALMAGGDVDTMAAIAGGIVGARMGEDAIPKETIAVRGKENFLLKPGLPGRNEDDRDVWTTYLIRPIVEASTRATDDSVAHQLRDRFDQLALPQIMGAIYGAVVHHGVFYVLFRAAVEKDYRYRHVLYPKFQDILETFRETFALSRDFSETDFFQIMSQPCKDAGQSIPISVDNNGCFAIERHTVHRVLLDMMIYKDKSVKSVVTRNLNNLDYVRKRRSRDSVGDYDRVSTIDRNTCPQVTQIPSDDTLQYIVHGDTWYSVNDDSDNLYSKVMKHNHRDYKAGPSGSTFMWMNFVFQLLDYPSNKKNLSILLLCIIADFVPYYHTVSEILHVFSREAANYVSGVRLYTYDMKPKEWLEEFLGFNVEQKR